MELTNLKVVKKIVKIVQQVSFQTLKCQSTATNVRLGSIQECQKKQTARSVLLVTLKCSVSVVMTVQKVTFKRMLVPAYVPSACLAHTLVPYEKFLAKTAQKAGQK